MKGTSVSLADNNLKSMKFIVFPKSLTLLIKGGTVMGIKRNFHHSPKKFYAYVAGISVLVVMIVLYYLIPINPYLIWLLGVNVVTFAFWGFDKRQAELQGGRVPEVILHILVLTGGFFGGWKGRSLFRHKTQKTTFLYVLISSTIIHIIIAYKLLF
jgi:uncharacterized membrane protein YsdA (DUF1294 family)